MKKLHRKDIETIKAALKHIKETGNMCTECPMSLRHNRLKESCSLYIKHIGGEDILSESVRHGCRNRHETMRYMLQKSKETERNIKI